MDSSLCPAVKLSSCSSQNSKPMIWFFPRHIMSFLLERIYDCSRTGFRAQFPRVDYKKKVILLSVVIVLGVAFFAQAQEGELHGTVDVTYWSKFIWRGFACFGPHGSMQPRVDLDLFQTGFGLDVIGRLPISSGYVNVTRWDFNVYYGNKAFGSPFSYPQS